MLSSCKVASHTERSDNSLLDLLRVFQEMHHLRREQLASLLRITPKTLEEWFSDKLAPPASYLALTVLFDSGSHSAGRVG